MMFLFEVNPNKPLHKNYSFWLAICVPIVPALLLSLEIVKDAGPFCLTSDCQKMFIDHFQLPITILSLSVLFGVMVGRFHGSAQRVASYSQSQENNTFRNFYDHRKLFTEWLSGPYATHIQNSKYIKLENPTRLYSRLFSSNSPTNVSTNLSIKKVQSAFNDAAFNIHSHLVQFTTAFIVRECSPNYAISPEDATLLLRHAINGCNSSLKPFGITLLPMEEWPYGKDGYDFERVLNEVTSIFTLAAEFSASDNPQKIEVPKPLAEQVRIGSMQCYISLALELGVDRESNNS